MSIIITFNYKFILKEALRPPFPIFLRTTRLTRLHYTFMTKFILFSLSNFGFLIPKYNFCLKLVLVQLKIYLRQRKVVGSVGRFTLVDGFSRAAPSRGYDVGPHGCGGSVLSTWGWAAEFKIFVFNLKRDHSTRKKILHKFLMFDFLKLSLFWFMRCNNCISQLPNL